MPPQYAELALQQPPHRIICDYIAGMTDHFLLRQCHDLLGISATPTTESRRGSRQSMPSIFRRYFQHKLVIVRLVSTETISTGGFLDIAVTGLIIEIAL